MIIKRGDIIVIITVVLAAVLIGVALFLNRTEGNYIKLTVNGEVYGTYPLNTEKTVKLNNNGKNTLVIDNGSAYFKDSDCPDKICEKTGRISKVGDSAVCLPHRVIAEVVEK